MKCRRCEVDTQPSRITQTGRCKPCQRQVMAQLGLAASNDYYCKHGTYVGDPYGPDYLCGACEMG